MGKMGKIEKSGWQGLILPFDPFSIQDANHLFYYPFRVNQ